MKGNTCLEWHNYVDYSCYKSVKYLFLYEYSQDYDHFMSWFAYSNAINNCKSLQVNYNMQQSNSTLWNFKQLRFFASSDNLLHGGAVQVSLTLGHLENIRYTTPQHSNYMSVFKPYIPQFKE